MKEKTYIQLDEKYGAQNYHPLDVVLTRGQGVWVWDVKGKKYLDCLAGYSAINQGHCHPKIIAALQNQAKEITLTARAFRNDQYGEFCRAFCRLAKFDKVLLMNTGAEAVETAIKLARKWGYEKKKIKESCAEIIVARNNFHGRTVGIVSFSTEDQYRQGFGPFLPGFKIVEYNDVKALGRATNKNTAAVLLEPVQGESGIIFPSVGYLKKVRSFCTKNNVLLMLDEIQSGFGRTGKMFAFQHENIKPDVLIVGKALSGGCYPVSGVLADKEIMSVFRPGDHGSTYGGNPLAAAIGLASLKVMQSERLVERSAKLGKYLLEQLQRIHNPLIKEIRGRGLWIGIELFPAAGGARKFCEKLMELGVLCKETHEQVIRVSPPLVITRQEIDWLIKKIFKIFNTF